MVYAMRTVCMCVCESEYCICLFSTSLTQSRPLLSPLVDVVFQLLVQLVLLDSLFPLCKCLIPLHGGVGHCFIFVVRHFGGFCLSGPLSSQGRILAPLVKSV